MSPVALSLGVVSDNLFNSGVRRLGMADIAFLAAFTLLPVAVWWVSRSVVFLTVGLILGYGLAGNLAQTLIALGVDVNVRGLQLLVLLAMGVLVFLARLFRPLVTESLRTQVQGVFVPAIAIGALLIVLRLMAPEDPGPLSAIGYFINHPLAEDNAKWLNLSAQVADGRDIVFNGYAGGPLLLLMATFSPLISVLSMVFLGGVNEVAVAANSVLAVQFFLISAVPFALATFTAWRNRLGQQVRVPPPVLWLSALVLALSSAIVTSYGHLSQQFTFIILTLWIAAFVTRAPRWVLLGTSLAIATTVSVWVPLNLLGLAMLIVALVVTVRSRWWWGIVLTGAVAITCFDAILSSIVYLLGIRVSLPIPPIGGLGSDADSTYAAIGESGDLVASAHLFRAPGATEQTSASLALLAIAVSLTAVWFLSKKEDLSDRLTALAVAPILTLLVYVLVMTAADAFITGSSPNYGATKMAFTIVVATIAAGIPVSLLALDSSAPGMTALRWAGIAGVVALLLLDSLLPRAMSALSPVLWRDVDTAAPVFWSAAEVRDSGNQPLEGSPIACLFAPPESVVPSALPLGQESYSCTRLLTGLAGLEGDASRIGDWLLTDWQSQSANWNGFRDSIAKLDSEVLDRSVIVMNEGGGLAGLTTLRELIERN